VWRATDADSDSANGQKRQNRYSSRTEVHSGYTEAFPTLPVLAPSIPNQSTIRAALYLRVSTRTDESDHDAAGQRRRNPSSHKGQNAKFPPLGKRAEPAPPPPETIHLSLAQPETRNRCALSPTSFAGHASTKPTGA
jgi:hypothetical protein